MQQLASALDHAHSRVRATCNLLFTAQQVENALQTSLQDWIDGHKDRNQQIFGFNLHLVSSGCGSTAFGMCAWLQTVFISPLRMITWRTKFPIGFLVVIFQNSYCTSRIGSENKIAFNLNNHQIRRLLCQRLLVLYSRLTETVLSRFIFSFLVREILGTSPPAITLPTICAMFFQRRLPVVALMDCFR